MRLAYPRGCGPRLPAVRLNIERRVAVICEYPFTSVGFELGFKDFPGSDDADADLA
jgi:hypothetical protein